MIVPPVSVAAVHDKFTCTGPDGVATRLLGGVNVGGVTVAADLNAATAAPQLSDAPSDALAEIFPETA